jgi:ABC-type bacteriocin/lantibiotic exporter with double-glycine peptidase domain
MERGNLYRLIKRLWKHIEVRRRVQLNILFILIIFSSFAEVISIGAVLPFLGVLTSPEVIFDHHLAKPFVTFFNILTPKDLLLPLTIVFSVAILFSAAMRLITLWVQTRLSYAVGADLSISIYRRTLFQPYSVHVSRNSSEVISSISSKVNSVISNILMSILTILNSLLMIFMILAVLLTIDPAIALSAFAGFGGIYIFVIQSTKRRLRIHSERISQESNHVIKALQEGLGGIRDVLIDGTQSVYCEVYQKADGPLRRAQANVVIIASTPRFGIEALGMVLIAILALSLAGGTNGLVTAIPVLGALALGAQRMLPIMQQAYGSWTAMRGTEGLLRDTLDLLDQELPNFADTGFTKPISFKSDIKLDNLSFRYAQGAPWVVQNFNLTIPKGARIGFIGSTGSGKSTLLDIVMGLLQPTTGSLSIDSELISQENYRNWQAHIAHVPQAIFLADSTIAENIAFGVPEKLIDHARVKEAASKAQIAKTIESWDKQYNTFVGERGVRLSGGQRQRIGIARALYKNADVIVFDEATSALDNETEQNVMEAIESLGDELTILIVAHRLSTLKKCTDIVELANGNIIRTGTYQEIVNH